MDELTQIQRLAKFLTKNTSCFLKRGDTMLIEIILRSKSLMRKNILNDNAVKQQNTE